MDSIGSVRALEKLLDFTASGIGSIAGPMLAPWKARREAAAQRIAAEGEAATQRITAEGEADALRTIAAAQADARNALVSNSSGIQGEIDIAETVSQRIQFQEEKRHRNIGSVVGQAADLLGDTEVPNQDPDHDWTARFFNHIQDISSEEMQALWARVLAGQIKKPGSVSIKTLSAMANLDQKTAIMFLTASVSFVTMETGPQFGKERTYICQGLQDQDDILTAMHITIDDPVDRLAEYGLVIPHYNPFMYRNLQHAVMSHLGNAPNQVAIRVPFKLQGRHWVLEPAQGRDPNAAVPFKGIALSSVGEEIHSIVDKELVPQWHKSRMDWAQTRYLQTLSSQFASQNLTMIEANEGEMPIITPRNELDEMIRRDPALQRFFERATSRNLRANQE